MDFVCHSSISNSQIKNIKERVYDKDGFSLRGSCIVWDTTHKNFVLLIKSKKYDWCFPGGAYEKKDKNIQETAIRELEEETGIKGNIFNYVGNFKDYNGKNKHSNFIWDTYPIGEKLQYKEKDREKKWFSFLDAVEVLKNNKLHQHLLIISKYNLDIS